MSKDLIDMSEDAKAHMETLCGRVTIDEKWYLRVGFWAGGNGVDLEQDNERWPLNHIGVGKLIKDETEFGDLAPLQFGSRTAYIHYEDLIRLMDKRITLQDVAVGNPNPSERIVKLLVPVEKNPS